MNIGLKIFLSGIILVLASLFAFGVCTEHDLKTPRWVPVLAVGSGIVSISGLLIWIWTA